MLIEGKGAVLEAAGGNEIRKAELPVSIRGVAAIPL